MTNHMPTLKQKCEVHDPRAKSRRYEGLRAKIGWKLRCNFSRNVRTSEIRSRPSTLRHSPGAYIVAQALQRLDPSQRKKAPPAKPDGPAGNSLAAVGNAPRYVATARWPAAPAPPGALRPWARRRTARSRTPPARSDPATPASGRPCRGWPRPAGFAHRADCACSWWLRPRPPRRRQDPFRFLPPHEAVRHGPLCAAYRDLPPVAPRPPATASLGPVGPAPATGPPLSVPRRPAWAAPAKTRPAPRSRRA